VPPEFRGSDLGVVREQLGREPSTSFDVIVRCPSEHPLVIRDAPIAADGSPFPTMFWLTCPDAVAAVSRLEADGWIARLNERYDSDAAFHADLDRAHAEAAAERARVLPEAGTWGGVGGTRRGVKCLHAHYANHLAGGDDVVGAWVATPVEPIHAEHVLGERIAVIDQGTHSCRVLVVEHARGGEPAELASDMIITKLGEGVDASGALNPAAVARTEFVFARYCRRARALGAARIRVAATSAVRDATNRELFIEMVRRHAGTDPEVIGGDEEARLSFLGGTRGLDADDGPFLLVDIGGGSTEFVVGREPGRADRRISTQMGSVRLTERFVGTDPPDAGELAAMRREIGDRLDEAELAVPEIHIARTFVSVAGTATTIQAIALGLARYDVEATHRSWLSVEDCERVVADLAAMTNPERAAIPVMAPGRGDVIVAGGEILVAALRRLGFERTLVSETDILQGLAWDTLGLG
jgi:exopolyphosphatase / guanosine-5'-triphosphate,3'-diphosphate pyrophosphatase